MFKEGIDDLSIAIKLDAEMIDSYLLRGRFSFIVHDTNQAFLDFQKLIIHKPKDPIMHIHAGNLLMITNSFEDAHKVSI
jgi:hypothetical protein